MQGLFILEHRKSCGSLTYFKDTDMKSVNEVIATAAVIDIHADLGYNISKALEREGYTLCQLSVMHAVSLCLRNGYSFWRPSLEHPVQHPFGDHAMQHREAKKRGELWNDQSQYGKRRMQALEHIRAQAANFYTEDGELLYVHR